MITQMVEIAGNAEECDKEYDKQRKTGSSSSSRNEEVKRRAQDQIRHRDRLIASETSGNYCQDAVESLLREKCCC